jgi:hypothetical protein
MKEWREFRTSNETGPLGPGFGLPLRGLQWSFPHATGCWSYGKFQNSNIKQQTNDNDQNPKYQTRFGHLILEFEICL